MKKFFATLLTLTFVLAMSCLVSAADVTLYEAGDDGDNWLFLETADLASYPDDAVITITIKRVRDEADPGYAYCVSNSADESWQWWSGHSVADTAVGLPDLAVGATTDITITVGQVRAYAEAGGGTGAVLNCYNPGGLIPVKAVVSGADATETGDATPVVIVAVMAMVSCAAVVVLRKKEA